MRKPRREVRGCLTRKSKEKIIEILMTKGNEQLEQHYDKVNFTESSEANEFLNNLMQFPHAFVLGCVMDRQSRAEENWLVPYEISRDIGGFEFSDFLKLDLNIVRSIFRKKKLHRFKDVMAEIFYLAIQEIRTKYNSDASNIGKAVQKVRLLSEGSLDSKGLG